MCVEPYIFKSRKMAGRQYLTDPNSRFFSVEEDEVDDETFLRHSKSGSSGYMLPNHSYQEKNSFEDDRLQLRERKKLIEERTIQSSERSISLLRDSEQIGVATAEVYCCQILGYVPITGICS